MRMTVLENATLAVLPKINRLGFLSANEEPASFEPVARRLALHCPSVAAPVSQLSGGNQQKVLLARWLLLNPEVLFLDDPTRGIDIGAKNDLYALFGALAAEGLAVVMLSTELDEHVGLMDRVLVFREHELFKEFERSQVTRERLVSAFFGEESEA
jgi:ribose transport system ATP-binding protein